MDITNRFGEPVCVYQYTPGDLLWSLTVDGGPQLAVAHSELPIHVGGTKELFDPGHLGVKRGEGGPLAAFEPYLGTPSIQVYPRDAELEIDATGEIIWLNRPVDTDPTPRLEEDELRRPLPESDGYVVGVGAADVTDAAAHHKGSSLPLQGWASPGQVSSHVESPLTARAFIVGDPSTGERVVLVIADIWSCTIALKEAVIDRLQGDGIPYRMDNVHIAGTHTHSGPAGYSHHLLYNLMAGGFDAHVFESMVRGIVAAIERAHSDLAPGTVRVNTGDLRGVAFNRSLEAFQRNPADILQRFPDGVDERMTLLRFDHVDAASGRSLGIGAINWFAVHPTNRGKGNTAVNGDNKGWASKLFEEWAPGLAETRRGFVAAFANSAAGDVSGNVDERSGQFDPVQSDDPDELGRHIERMKRTGELQAQLAVQLYEHAEHVLKGPIGSVHQHINLVERTGAWGALGLSMGAGSTEDGGPGPLPEGLRLDADNQIEGWGIPPTGALSAVAAYVVDPLVNLLLAAPTPLAWIHSLARSVIDESAPSDFSHHPKPIMLRTGATRPSPLTPNVVPIQLVRIGGFVALSVPAEPTTAAGLAMHSAVARRFKGRGVHHVVVAGYANGYASYITTEEEYRSQQYEGASTLHGPRTCEAYASAFAGLAGALRDGTVPVDDAPPFDRFEPNVVTKTRMTFRNHTRGPVRIRIYLVDDREREWTLWAGGEFDVDGARTTEEGALLPSDRALIFPLHLAWITSVRVDATFTTPVTGRTATRTVHARTTDLVSILADGRISSGPYVAQLR